VGCGRRMRGRRADSLLPVAIDRESGNSSPNAQRIVHFVIIELSFLILYSQPWDSRSEYSILNRS